MSAQAELLLYNANVITMNPRQPHAQAVAIRDGRIIEVGDNSLVNKTHVPPEAIKDITVAMTIIKGAILWP